MLLRFTRFMVLAVVLFGSAGALLAKGLHGNIPAQIFLDDGPKSGWEIVLVDDKPYFSHFDSRELRADDQVIPEGAKIKRTRWVLQGYRGEFLLQLDDDDKNIYLTGDYSTDLPGVAMTKPDTATGSVGDNGRWRFTSIDKEFYIENLNQQKKQAWLSIADHGFVEKNIHGVSELRRVVLSYDKKAKFAIDEEISK